MIQTKQDLKDYLSADFGGKKYNMFILWLKGSELLPTVSFLRSLRHYEYYYNQKKLSLIGKIKKQFWRFVYRHNELKYSIYIGTNTCGPGLHLMHPGFRRMHTIAIIGKEATILPMVLIGKKNPHTNCNAIIGDNVYISTGVTILAPVVIGNNVTIGAGAVVTKDIPDNAVVAGVPAKIIKMKDEK